MSIIKRRVSEEKESPFIFVTSAVKSASNKAQRSQFRINSCKTYKNFRGSLLTVVYSDHTDEYSLKNANEIYEFHRETPFSLLRSQTSTTGPLPRIKWSLSSFPPYTSWTYLLQLLAYRKLDTGHIPSPFTELMELLYSIIITICFIHFIRV